MSFFAPPERPGGRTRELSQTVVDDRSGRVLESWTGYKVEWTMARGYAGAFGRVANALWIWLPLCALFVLPFARPPLRLLHLDLAVLLAFSVSYAFFGAARIDVSVPLVYPLLAYLLARMLGDRVLAGARARAAAAAPDACRWRRSGIGAVFLLGFRCGLNVVGSNVIDVGYASVIGADHFGSGEAVYGNFPLDNQRGDTYGPGPLLRLRAVRGAAAVARRLGRPAGRARRRGRVRPADRGRAVAARAAAARAGARARCSPTRGRRSRSRCWWPTRTPTTGWWRCW